MLLRAGFRPTSIFAAGQSAQKAWNRWSAEVGDFHDRKANSERPGLKNGAHLRCPTRCATTPPWLEESQRQSKPGSLRALSVEVRPAPPTRPSGIAFA
jgi:hypothetical protein